MKMADSLKIFYNPRMAFESMPDRKILPISVFLFVLALLNGITQFHVLDATQTTIAVDYAGAVAMAIFIPLVVIFATKILFVGRMVPLINITNVYFHSFMPKILVTTAMIISLLMMPGLKDISSFNKIINVAILVAFAYSIVLFVYGINKSRAIE